MLTFRQSCNDKIMIWSMPLCCDMQSCCLTNKETKRNKMSCFYVVLMFLYWVKLHWNTQETLQWKHFFSHENNVLKISCSGVNTLTKLLTQHIAVSNVKALTNQSHATLTPVKLLFNMKFILLLYTITIIVI